MKRNPLPHSAAALPGLAGTREIPWAAKSADACVEQAERACHLGLRQLSGQAGP
jgi:hypothetical protein